MAKVTIKSYAGPNRIVTDKGEEYRLPVNVAHPAAGKEVEVDVAWKLGKVAEAPKPAGPVWETYPAAMPEDIAAIQAKHVDELEKEVAKLVKAEKVEAPKGKAKKDLVNAILIGNGFKPIE